MKQLLSILKRLTPEDAKALEQESNSLQSVGKISTAEAWELEKVKDKDADYGTFKNNFNKTIKLDE